jgi:hypothetical protein
VGSNAGAEGLNSRVQAIRISPVDTATANTSKPPSTSTLADWHFIRKPLNIRKRLLKDDVESH